MNDTASQLPADIRDSAVELAKLISTNGAYLRKIRAADSATDAYDALGEALLNQMTMSGEVQRLLAWIKVGQMPQIGVVESRQAAEQSERTLMLRSLHRAGDHTMDPDPEPEQLTLEVAR